MDQFVSYKKRPVGTTLKETNLYHNKPMKSISIYIVV